MIRINPISVQEKILLAPIEYNIRPWHRWPGGSVDRDYDPRTVRGMWATYTNHFYANGFCYNQVALN